MGDAPELELFSKLAQAIGESLEDVCNLNDKERDELLIACCLKTCESNQDDKEHNSSVDIQEFSSDYDNCDSTEEVNVVLPTSQQHSNTNSAKRKKFFLSRARKRTSLNPTNEEDETGSAQVSGGDDVGRTNTHSEEIIELKYPSPQSLPDITLEQEGLHSEEDFSDDLTKSRSNLDTEEDVDRRLEFEEFLGFLSIRHKVTELQKESVAVWYSPPSSIQNMLEDCSSIDLPVLETMSVVDQDMKEKCLTILSDQEALENSFGRYGNQFYEECVSSRPDAQEFTDRISKTQTFSIDRDWMQMAIKDVLLIDEDEMESSTTFQRSCVNSSQLISDVESDSFDEYFEQKEKDCMDKKKGKRLMGKEEFGRKGRKK